MNVTVIIPTFNGEKELSSLLPALAHQNIDFELLIIDSSSTDGTIPLAKKYADRVIRIPQVKFDHGGTRTLAAKEARGDILVFMTQDALPAHHDALQRLVHALKKQDIGAVYGRQLPYPDTSVFGTHLRLFNYPEEASYVRRFHDKEIYGIKTAFLSDSFAAYKKDALEEIGWFKDGLILGEDMHAAARLLMKGYGVAYCSEAKVYHAHSYSITEEFKRYFDTGVFHNNERWILDTYGHTKGEGGRYVRSEFKFLLSRYAYLHIPAFFIRNAAKYLGYKLGVNYHRLPKSWRQRLSMHPEWWNNR